MAGLSTAKTIERWLLPHQVTSYIDHVAELGKVIRRLVQATDKISAALAWSADEARYSRLSESGVIPPYWVQEIRKALADDDWLQAQGTLATLLGALPAPSEFEQTSQIVQSYVRVRQWSCHGDRIYLDDTQSQTTLYGPALDTSRLTARRGHTDHQ